MTRRRWPMVVYLLVGALWALALVPVAEAATGTGDGARTSGPDRAVVVVDDGVSGPRQFCVTFSGSVTGIQALRATGLTTVLNGFSGMGSAVCAIDGTGCSASACLTCDIPRYWQYLRAAPGAAGLSPSGGGGSSSTVVDGGVEYWRWTTGGALPPKPSVDAVCGARPPATPPPTPPPPPPPPPPPSGPSPTPPAGPAPPPAAPPSGQPPAGGDPDPAPAPSAGEPSTGMGGGPAPSGEGQVDDADGSDQGGSDDDDADGDDRDGDGSSDDDAADRDDDDPPSAGDDGDDERGASEGRGAGAFGAGSGEQRAVGVDEAAPGTGDASGSSWVGLGLVAVVVGGLGAWAVVLRRRGAM